MIFNEIQYIDLFYKKLKAFSDLQAKKFEEMNKEPITFTPLTAEAQMEREKLIHGEIKEEDIPSHILEEFDNFAKERMDFSNDLLNGKLKAPLVTQKELKELIPSIKEVKELCTTSIDDYMGTLKEMVEQGSKDNG
jgi:hypothetical protein